MFTQSYQKQEQVPSDDFTRTWKWSRAEKRKQKKWQKLWFAEFSHCHPIQSHHAIKKTSSVKAGEKACLKPKTRTGLQPPSDNCMLTSTNN